MTFIVVCAWCGEVLKYELDGKPTQTSHGICQTCKDAMLMELEGVKTDGGQGNKKIQEEVRQRP